MKLSELNKGEIGIIQKIDTNGELKERLYSFGVARGSEVRMEEYSIGKQTIAIVVDDTVIGLRTTEASQIIIKKTIPIINFK